MRHQLNIQILHARYVSIRRLMPLTLLELTFEADINEILMAAPAARSERHSMIVQLRLWGFRPTVSILDGFTGK